MTLLRHVTAPQTTPDCIVFPYDQKTRRFITAYYNPSQTKHRISAYEVENFLQRVNSPIAKWYYDYDNETCGMYCLLYLSFVILPLLPILACWAIYNHGQSVKDLQKITEKARAFVTKSNSHFSSTGYIWNVPHSFPHWIELKAKSISQQDSRGIKTISMPQKYYQMTRAAPEQNYNDSPLESP